MKYYSYIRVSTPTQSIQRQIDNINSFKQGTMQYAEKYTGTTITRPAFDELIKAVDNDIKQGEEVTIIFDSVSRMSRTATDGIEQYFKWYDSGVNLVFLNERHIDTSVFKQAIQKAKINIEVSNTATGKLIGTIVSALTDFQKDLAKEQIAIAFEQAEKEVTDLHKRTKDGMSASGAGKKISQARTGKTYTTIKELKIRVQILKKLKKYGGVFTAEQIAKLNDVSRMSVHRYLQHIEQDLETATATELIARYNKLIEERETEKKE